MNFQTIEPMPLHPIAQQMIRKVEELSGRLVHVPEDPELKVMAGIRQAPFLRTSVWGGIP